MKWLKPERVKECKELQGKALQIGAPLIVQFPTSSIGSSHYRHFSVFTADSNQSINRVVVTVDSETLLFTGKCCGTGSFCVHRNLVKWYIKQHEPSLLDRNESQSSIPVSASSFKLKSSSTIIYPPDNKDLSKKMLMYMYNFKKLPPDLPMNLTVQHCDYKKRYDERATHCLSSYINMQNGIIDKQTEYVSVIFSEHWLTYCQYMCYQRRRTLVMKHYFLVYCVVPKK